ncbi:MAG: hypothetical protein E7668_05230 [Ruminococcaceae bacterium]|nr:hypothetical protein [Oscillospiraceae bacterium]
MAQQWESVEKSKRRLRPALRFFLLALAGLLAGFANGLLGAGGGIVIVLALARLLEGSELEGRDLYANALCIMLPISAVSCLRYALAGNLTTEGFGVYALPAIVGGLLGGVLLSKLKAPLLKKLFGTLVIWSGILLILR